MTLVCAWVRKVGSTEELVVASDSRLTGGMTWDHGQKIFPLARGDSVLAFAGETFFAYPLILQTLRYIDDYDRAESRAMSLEDMKGHLEKVLTDLIQAIRDWPVGKKGEQDDELYKFTLLLAGYSVASKKWGFWVSRVDKKSRKLRFTKGELAGGHQGALFVGSGAPAAIQTFKADRAATWKAGSRPAPTTWEPLDVLRDMISSNAESSVGGPIQIVKVYKHLNTMPYAVFWPKRSDSDARVTLFGRALLPYERTQRLALDPETHEVFKLWDYLPNPVPQIQAQQKRRGGKELRSNVAALKKAIISNAFERANGRAKGRASRA